MSVAASPAAKVLGQPRGAATEAKRKLAADDDDEDDEDDEDADNASVATYDSLLESGGESDEEAVDAEKVPGREEYASDVAGALEWAAAALAFTEVNFKDGGGEVRTLDQRDCKVVVVTSSSSSSSRS